MVAEAAAVYDPDLVSSAVFLWLVFGMTKKLVATTSLNLGSA